MATLNELYVYLETKRNPNPVDSLFPWGDFAQDEKEESRFEILVWRKIERIAEDKDFPIDRGNAVAYYKRRIDKTNNLFLIYRYAFFAYLLSDNNLFAKKAIDALIDSIGFLLPEDKNAFPFNASDAIGHLFKLSKRIKYRLTDVTDLAFGILDSDYGFKTKLTLIEKAKESTFFTSTEAERLTKICKDIYPSTQERWKERCCLLGLFYAVKLQDRGKEYVAFFNESLGDFEFAKYRNTGEEPNNIIIPHLNDSCLEKTMQYYKNAGAIKKMKQVGKLYSSNKKKLRYIPISSRMETDKRVIDYFTSLEKELLSRESPYLLSSLVIPDIFLFPSFDVIAEKTSVKSSTELLGFEEKLKDINGNTQNTKIAYQTRKMYETWLLEIIRKHVLSVILSAVWQKKLTYAKTKNWFLKYTCLGTPIEHVRGNQVVSSTLFSQIDYVIKDLMLQYKRFAQKKPTDWRVSVDELSIRFEGILRTIVDNCGGQTVRLGRDGCTTEAVLLDDLLRESTLLKVFSKDDIDFFEYVFTAKGFNIRNNVAHAFYIPQDYNVIKATLVFLCILRLTKFQPQETE